DSRTNRDEDRVFCEPRSTDECAERQAHQHTQDEETREVAHARLTVDACDRHMVGLLPTHMWFEPSTQDIKHRDNIVIWTRATLERLEWERGRRRFSVLRDWSRQPFLRISIC